MSLAGIQPLAPGFRRCEIRPQLADLKLLELTVHTVQGRIELPLEHAYERRHTKAQGRADHEVHGLRQSLSGQMFQASGDTFCHAVSTK
jgi:hypothetical protein